MKTAIYGIVAARRGSTRFPDKVLADILGKPMLQRVLERVQMAGLLERVILATTPNEEDKVLLDLATRLGFDSFAGSEQDVLDRFYRCAEGANTIVRITSDCPLIDPKLIDGMLQYHFLCENDITTSRPSYPDGMDIEVISYPTLQRTWEEATLPYDREHVTTYPLAYPERFKVGRFLYDVDLPEYHWSVDYPEDLEFISTVYEVMGEYFTFADLISAVGVGALG